MGHGVKTRNGIWNEEQTKYVGWIEQESRTDKVQKTDGQSNY